MIQTYYMLLLFMRFATTHRLPALPRSWELRRVVPREGHHNTATLHPRTYVPNSILFGTPSRENTPINKSQTTFPSLLSSKLCGHFLHLFCTPFSILLSSNALHPPHDAVVIHSHIAHGSSLSHPHHSSTWACHTEAMPIPLPPSSRLPKPPSESDGTI